MHTEKEVIRLTPKKVKSSTPNKKNGVRVNRPRPSAYNDEVRRYAGKPANYSRKH